MKKLLTLVLVLAVMATFGGLASAGPQPSATPKPLATTVRSGKSNSDNRATTVNGTKSNTYRGKVLQIDPKTRIFVLHGEGVTYKFVLPKGGAQPKVGAVVDVTYTGALGGAEPAQATTVSGSRSNGSL
jgi:hypothetical protein